MRPLRTLLFPQRIGRASFGVRTAVFDLLLYAFLAVDSGPSRELIARSVVLLAGVYFLVWVVLPRMRDLGIRPFWLVLTFIPLVNVVFGLILLSRPGRIDCTGLPGASEGQAAEAGEPERIGG
jgi:hypothetical protein